MPSGDVLLDVQGVALTREGRTILHDINLHVLAGEIHALLGINGSGKSSLAYAIMGCEEYHPDAGASCLPGATSATCPCTNAPAWG
jgi:Fe-S cluster assembly ATP-binding protein